MSSNQADITLIDSVVPDTTSVYGQAKHALLERKDSHLAAMQRIDECQTALIRATELLTKTLGNGHTVLTLGNGGSAAEAQHFAAELVGRFRLERRAYPVLALTTDSSILTAVANDYGYDDVFSRQIEAFAREGDLVIAFSTSGESRNAVQAAVAARKHGAMVIAMTGSRMSTLGQSADIVVQAPSADTPTIQELHTLFTHVLCDVAESALSRHQGGSVV
ncbi:D-sedoheptulose 7-phosphate isomerase [soil metagenome]